MEAEQAKFEGWALVEMMGHQREVGHVTTEYYGPAALFRVDVPELPDREWVLEKPEWGPSGMLAPGTKVQRPGVAGRSRLISPGAIYAITPCTEEAARKALDRDLHRDLKVIELPKGQELKLEAPCDGRVGSEEEECEGCGEPAVTHDSEGVPLCRECAEELEGNENAEKK